MDSDDILHPQMYEHLADALQAEQADVAICKETFGVTNHNLSVVTGVRYGQ